MHGARRRLSEPRIAGKAPTVWFSSQRLTSVGDSFLLMYTCGLSHTYCQVENSCQKNATNPGFYVLTSVSRQKLASADKHLANHVQTTLEMFVHVRHPELEDDLEILNDEGNGHAQVLRVFDEFLVAEAV